MTPQLRRFWTTLAFLASSAPLVAQGVVVAPQGVFIDDRVRGGSLELYNPGAEPVDVTVGTAFGYPTSDSLGATVLELVEGADTTGRSAAAWLEAFPRRLILQPHERQTVRLLARPPRGLHDGEYWARLVVTARGGSVPVAGVPDSGAVRVALTLEVRTIIAALYRKGAVATGVALSAVRAEHAGDSLRIVGRFVRRGNAAYIGTARVGLVNAAGKEVAAVDRPIAVYYELAPAFALPAAGLAPGTYTLRLEAVTERADVAGAALLRSTPARTDLIVVIPPQGR